MKADSLADTCWQSPCSCLNVFERQTNRQQEELEQISLSVGSNDLLTPVLDGQLTLLLAAQASQNVGSGQETPMLQTLQTLTILPLTVEFVVMLTLGHPIQASMRCLSIGNKSNSDSLSSAAWRNHCSLSSACSSARCAMPFQLCSMCTSRQAYTMTSTTLPSGACSTPTPPNTISNQHKLNQQIKFS